jgi:DNA-binding transcriptional MerR regulator
MKKLYYSISEVAELINEEQHILRYWEKEFDFLKPRKNRAGNRVYSEKDLFVLKLIKQYLREEKLTAKEASKIIKNILKKNDFESNESDNKININFNNNESEKIYIDKSTKVELLSLLRDLLNYLKSN